MQAAAESFAQFGVSDTTMEGIAARAGTSIGSVYQFFPNKRALFVEVAERLLADVRDVASDLFRAEFGVARADFRDEGLVRGIFDNYTIAGRED